MTKIVKFFNLIVGEDSTGAADFSLETDHDDKEDRW